MSESQRKPLPIYSFNMISKNPMHMKYTVLQCMNPQNHSKPEEKWAKQCLPPHEMVREVTNDTYQMNKGHNSIHICGTHFMTAIKITESQH
jgi:hypothetical protein